MSFLTNRVSGKTTSLISLFAILLFLPLFILASYQTVQLVTRAFGTPAKIVVDTKAPLETINFDFIRAFAQGGEEASDMLAGVINEVKSLRPQLIRIDHIYDHYDVVGRSGEELIFNWSRLDPVIDTILATGAKPLIALSYMPPVIARDGSLIAPPNNWDEWALVVQKTIEHMSGREARNISGVYYEVWNEPDLPQFGKWGLTGEKNYLTLYRYAARGAANAQSVNQYFLGGPGTTGLYKNWVLSLVESGNRIDFLSWHSYLSDPVQFSKDQRNLTTWLLPYPSYTLIPKIITEFGFTGGKDKRYGTSYASAHMAAVVRQLASGGPLYLFSFQLKDGPGQQDGTGWGLITHEDNGTRVKPRYSAFNFLDTIRGTRLALTGEGSWVTALATTRDGMIRLLLVNFDRDGSHIESVPVTFHALDFGNYVWREQLLAGRSVSFNESVSQSSITRTVFMPAQSIAIIELIKQ